MLPARILIVLLLLINSRLALAEGTWHDALPFRILAVAQNGMYPTFKKGDFLFARSGFLFERDELRRGDVVYFYREIDDEKYIFFWRLIALPGDQVEIGQTGQIKIDGKPLHRKKAGGAENRTIYSESNGDVVYRISISGEPKSQAAVSLLVPAGHVYLLGDNRNDAADSRYHGPVPISSIYGVIR
jgi:signal peptidase I